MGSYILTWLLPGISDLIDVHYQSCTLTKRDRTTFFFFATHISRRVATWGYGPTSKSFSSTYGGLTALSLWFWPTGSKIHDLAATCRKTYMWKDFMEEFRFIRNRYCVLSQYILSYQLQHRLFLLSFINTTNNGRNNNTTVQTTLQTTPHTTPTNSNSSTNNHTANNNTWFLHRWIFVKKKRKNESWVINLEHTTGSPCASNCLVNLECISKWLFVWGNMVQDAQDVAIGPLAPSAHWKPNDETPENRECKNEAWAILRYTSAEIWR